jgi:LmbE family N-acetylglucosaminyl deacetylase
VRVVAVSPHLDDAAFSAGGTLAKLAGEGAAVTVVTCFTGNVAAPTGFALACQLDKGLAPDVDYMALRRAEDGAACAVIGAEAVHLPFLEAPHRGYESAPALFGARLAGDDMADRLAPALAPLVEGAELVLGPLGIGDHVDHHVVREALARVADPARLLLWEDWPYLDRVGHAPPDPAMRVALGAAEREARVAMCGAYTTQLGFQFGGAEAMTARIRAIGEERFHRPG